MPGPIPSFPGGFSLGMVGPIPLFLGGYSLGMPGPIALSLGSYSLGMPDPVPGVDDPSPRPSLGFFSPELCEFVRAVVVVVVCKRRGGEFVRAVVVTVCKRRGGEFVRAVVVTVIVVGVIVLVVLVVQVVVRVIKVVFVVWSGGRASSVAAAEALSFSGHRAMVVVVVLAEG